MTRKEELLNVVGNDPVLIRLVDDMVYLENELDHLRPLPKIKVDPQNPARQKATPASKQYKEYLQQYTNVVKIIARKTGADMSDEESPLRAWMMNHNETETR